MITEKQVFEWLNFTLAVKFFMTAYAIFYGVDWLRHIYDVFDFSTVASKPVLMFALLLAMLTMLTWYGIMTNMYSTKALAVIISVLLTAWLYTMQIKPSLALIFGGAYALFAYYLYFARGVLR